ncbi:FAD-dependent oxidoreductase [Actinomycetospora sp. TBRC 11914]|uniref:FAD-dependent oxidoreductase n=1 Tax=Actinomycetospora sp. TBRC 11914 TaxID=2729387 RepID=UPI00145DB7DB|nr:FAD-dependent oxidoreductase [Actinomycetospora sp. TBRC 11914]NMO89897.1 FAD-dependent oxidoreductase [Actinomycetospora sp. TBRC 11914]
MGPRVVIVGAGLVGCALADELTARGWTRVTVLDQGAAERPGGSTSHAPGVVFQTSGSRMLARVARASAARYGELRAGGRPCFRAVGGLEVAATRERLAELRRRHGSATAAGIESHLLDPAECAALHPLLDREVLLGGLHVPSDGVALPLAAARAQARAAVGRGAVVRHGVRVTGIDTAAGRVRGVQTDHGPLAAEVVVCAAGIWGPLVGAMAEVTVPLSPMAHQYAWTTPLRELDVLQKLRGLVDPGGAAFPVLRHADADLYVREHGDRLGVGAYAHRAMPADPAGLDRPGPDRGAVPAERAFTDLDFEPSWHAAQALLPALADAKVERGVNGLVAFTPDGMPLLGETAVRGLWLAEAVWTAHAAGVGQALAAWVVDGVPTLPEPGADPREPGAPLDVSAAHHDRFDPALLAPATVRSRACHAYDEVYDVVHPQRLSPTTRPLRTGPFDARHRELGAVVAETDGWAVPAWFGDNADLPEVCEVRPRRAWAGRHWSPIAGAEALVVRRAVALVDLTSRHRLEVVGPNALGLLQQLTTVDVDRPVGARTRALALDRAGRIRADLDVARLDRDRFAVGVATRLESRWLAEHVLGRVEVRDLSSGTCALGVWGPAAGVLLSRLTDPSGRARTADAVETHVGPVPVLALRGTPAGVDGVELRARADLGAALWDVLWDAGATLGIVAAGARAVTSLLVESGHRTLGTGIDAELTPAEAGLDHLVDPGKGLFLGREPALLGPRRRLVSLVLDEPGEVVLGGEPVRDGEECVGRVAASEVAHAEDVSLALAVVPPRLAVEGTELTVEYFDRRVGARVVER